MNIHLSLLVRKLALFVFLAGLDSAVHAVSYNSTNYDVYSGDANDDGNSSDIVLVGKEKFVLIASNGINIPLILPAEQSYALYQQEDGSFSEPTAVALTEQMLALFTLAQVVTDYTFEDLNADGKADFNYTNTTLGYPVILSHNSYGNVAVLSNGGAPDSGTQLLTNPNENHISVHEYSNFSVASGEIYTIYNLPSNRGDADETVKVPAADTIVIYADVIDIRGKVSVIGPATDIIFVKKDTGADTETIACHGCEFQNVARLVLAAAEVKNTTLLPDSAEQVTASNIGLFSIMANGRVSITDLYAPSLLSLDVLADTFEHTGTIDLNTRSSKEFTGGYSADPNSNYTIGTGSIGIFLGWMDWSYEHRQIDRRLAIDGLEMSDREYDFSGSFEAPNIRIAAIGDIVLSGNFNTRTDAVGSSYYRGELKMPEEELLVQALKERTESLGFIIKPGSQLVVTGAIKSDGLVNLHTSGDFQTAGSSVIEAHTLQFIAGGNYYHHGSINSEFSHIAANDIVNYSSIKAVSTAHFSAEDDFFNYFGGHILANKIELEVFGIVRNGADTPYEENEANTLRGSSLQYAQSLLDNLQNQNIDSFSSTQHGSFYHQGLSVDVNRANYVLAQDTSASIIGRDIEIVGSFEDGSGVEALENINPYYVFNTQDTTQIFNPTLSDQIVISAERKLTVKAEKYVLNSSAVIEQNEKQGSIMLDTPFVNNERFRYESNLTYFSTSTDTTYRLPDFDGGGVQEVVVTEGEGTAKVYEGISSPPGRIRTIGDFNVYAPNGSILNNLSYIEVMGDSELNVSSFASLGVLKNIDSVRAFTNAFNFVPTYSTTEDDTLFVVAGTLKANELTFWSENSRPFSQEGVEHYLSTDQQLVLEIEKFLVQLEVECKIGEPGCYLNPFDPIGSIAELEDSYQYTLEDDNTISINWDDEHFEKQCINPIFCSDHVISSYGEASVPLFELLKNYFLDVYQALQEAVTEINFWNA